MVDLSVPRDYALLVPQGADWAGISIPILAADGTPRTSLAGCTATGAIRYAPGGVPLYVWSTSPTPEQGLITFVGGAVQFGIPAADSALFTWTRARWQVDLIDPAAPAGLREIRAGQGPITVAPTYL